MYYMAKALIEADDTKKWQEIEDFPGDIHVGNGWVQGYYVDGFIVGAVEEAEEDYFALEYWVKVDTDTLIERTKGKPINDIYPRVKVLLDELIHENAEIKHDVIPSIKAKLGNGTQRYRNLLQTNLNVTERAYKKNTETIKELNTLMALAQSLHEH